MNKVILCAVIVVFLAACGVDGEPTRPKLVGHTKFGVSSGSGLVSNTDLSIVFSSN